MNKKIIFEYPAFEDFNQWASLDKKIYHKIVNLIRDIAKGKRQRAKGKRQILAVIDLQLTKMSSSL